MSKLLAAVLAWLMLLALPVQGMAAVDLLPCGMAHAGHGEAATGQDMLGHHAMTDPAPPSTGPALLDHDTMHAAGDATTAGAQGLPKCCGAGLSMAAIVGPALLTHGAMRPPVPLPPAFSLYQGVVLDGLERPPRA
jgi:hypothetical protein